MMLARAVELALGDDLDLVRQVRPQRAERDRLVRFMLLDQGRELATSAIGARRAVPRAMTQALPSLLTVPSGGQRDALGQRAADLFKDGDFTQAFASSLNAPLGNQRGPSAVGG